jgi:hypothetical protein
LAWFTRWERECYCQKTKANSNNANFFHFL